jgi:hypothetical protein
MSATNKQLKEQQGDHAGTAQPSSEQANDGSGLNADSASPSLCPFFFSIFTLPTWGYFLDQTGKPCVAFLTCKQHSD